MAADVTIVTQDPRFGGGAKAQLEAFLSAVASLGKTAETHYVIHPSLQGDAGEALGTHGARRMLSRFDAMNQLIGARRLAPRLRKARSLWVVSAVAPAGAAALRSGHPYACWIGTGLEDEWRSRQAGLPVSRRLALRVNAPLLLELERRVLRGARAVYATSPSSRQSVAAASGLVAARVAVLPIPVDVERFTPLPEGEWLAGLEAPVLAFVGRADDPRKNARLLLEALPEIRRRVPGTTVRLIGRAPRGPLPEGVESTGEVASVAEPLRTAALFVLPSLQEGFGVAVAEALACGIPVVTTPSGGPEELVRASGAGRVLSGFAPRELAETVAALLDAPTELVAMRRAGRAYVEAEHSPECLRKPLAELVGSPEIDG